MGIINLYTYVTPLLAWGGFLLYNNFITTFFMARIPDPLKYGFYGVDYVLWGKDRVAVYFDMIAAQQSMMSMLKRGVEVKGMREIKVNA